MNDNLEDAFDGPPDSGPYCDHGAEIWECPRRCTCGHTCPLHFDGDCDKPGCSCTEFAEGKA